MLRLFNHESLEEIPNLKDHLHLSASTSALQSTLKRTPDAAEAAATAESKLKAKEADLFVPTESISRSTTLPKRASMLKTGRIIITDIDSNPLRILRDKNYPIVRPRIRVNTSCEAPPEFPGIGDSDKDSACESPSYLTNTEYTFSERDVNIHRGDTQKYCGSKEIENLNPIPLPPRDRTKILLTNVKRHVRKHPLIIPASGLQRTLNKVKTPVEEKMPPIFPGMTVDEIDCGIKSPSMENNYNMPRTSTKPAEVTKLQPMDDHHSYMNQEDIHIGSAEDRHGNRKYTISTSSGDFNNEFRTYENLDTIRSHLDMDSASLHFESILESHLDDRASPDVANGFVFDNYDVPRVRNRHSISAIAEIKRPASFDYRNSDFERRRLEFAEKYPNYVQPRNELASNALFIKYKTHTDRNDNSIALRNSTSGIDGLNNNQSIDSDSLDDVNEEDEQILERKLKDSNSVSCEDLLEFSDKKPKGKERGTESDEVRIMSKVLGTVVSYFSLHFQINIQIHTTNLINNFKQKKMCFFFQATPEQCIIALDFIEWNVHKAIKLIRLQNAMAQKRDIPFEECVEILQQYDWDVQTASIQLSNVLQH